MIEQISLSKFTAISQSKREGGAIYLNFRNNNFSVQFNEFPRSYFLIEDWVNSDKTQRKWTIYETPIDCNLSIPKNSYQVTINAELKSSDNKTLALGFSKIYYGHKLGSRLSNRSCVIAHDLRNADGSFGDIYFMDKDKTTIKIPIEPNQIADIDSVEISVN